jgi:hypothetical protein
METKHRDLTTMTAILEQLRVRKHDNEFKLTEKGFTIEGKEKFYKPEDLTIIKTYRFEGESDPGDSSILYVIEANDGMIGYSTDAYGAYSNHDETYDKFIQEVKVEDRDEQILFGE